MPEEAEEEDDERVVHAIQMGLSPQPICSASTAACSPSYHRQNVVFCFYCSDFIRLMRKIVFVFQIFRSGFVFLFRLWYVLVCNH